MVPARGLCFQVTPWRCAGRRRRPRCNAARPDGVSAGAGPATPRGASALALEALGDLAIPSSFLAVQLTVQPHLASVLIHHLVQVNLVVRPGSMAMDRAKRRVRWRLAVVAQPGHVDTTRALQGLEHRLQRHPAGKHFGAAHETRTVQHQPQGRSAQSLPRAPWASAASALIVGEVVQRSQPEQLRHLLEQVRWLCAASDTR